MTMISDLVLAPPRPAGFSLRGQVDSVTVVGMGSNCSVCMDYQS